MSEKALDLIKHGLHPVLLGSSGDALKRPQLKGWQTATNTPEDVKAWPERANIGVRCGQTRKNKHGEHFYIYVFDFDKYAKEIFLKWWEVVTVYFGLRGICLQGLVVSTGKGYHVYVATYKPHSDRLLASEPVTIDGKIKNEVIIEIRGDNQQVVAAGSRHPSGHDYQFYYGSGYDAIPLIDDTDFEYMVAQARLFDRQPPKPKVKTVSVGAAVKFEGTGELTGITDCLDYARRFIGGEEKTEQNGDIRITGNGGLLLQADGRGWYCFSEQKGGGLADLIAWHKHITIDAALAMMRPVNNFTVYPGKHEQTIELHSGQFLGDVDFELPQRAYLKANTGIGKTSYAVTLPGKVILVVPTVAILQQQHNIHPEAAVYYHELKTVKGGENLIFTTPDSLPKIFPLIDSTEYTLVIDEAHNIGLAGYRRRAYDNVVRALGGDWLRVVLMTGTPLPLVTANLELFESVAVKSPVRTQQAQRVVYEEGESLAACVARVSRNGRNLIFLNDKTKKLDRLQSLLYQAGFIPDEIAVINADTRDTEAYAALVERETVPDMVKVVIATSVIAEGFNIRGDFDTVHLLARVSSVLAQQVVNRFRTAAAGVVYWYNRGEKKGGPLDINTVAKQILEDAQSLAAELNACEDADPNTDDVGIQEWRRARLFAARRVDNAQLIEEDEDIETGAKYYQPSPVGVNHAIYRTLERVENTHPELFKRNTAVYGWEWLQDLAAVDCLTKTEKDTAAAFADERAEERLVEIDSMLRDIHAAGPDVLEHNIKHSIGDGAYMGLGKAVLTFYDILGSFSEACEAALQTEGKTRRINTLKRRLIIQRERDISGPNLITDLIYQIFEPGDRLTPEQIQDRINAIYKSDPVLKLFNKPLHQGAPEQITPRKAVQILADYYELKRCKMEGAVNGWLLQNDQPKDCNFSLNSFDSIEKTEFSEKIEAMVM